MKILKVRNKQIITYDFGKTDEKNIFAIGDVAGLPWLAHKASHEGIRCVEFITKTNTKASHNTNSIPSCIYSNPQVASIGLTENQAKSNTNVKIGKFPLSANGKALALGESEGFVKTLFNGDTGEILGAHMIGPEVKHYLMDLMNTIFPHPTLSAIF